MTPQAKTELRDEEVYQAFSQILDEVDKMFSITTFGKWLAMSRVRSKGTKETLAFMERIAALGFRAVVTPEEKELFQRVHGKVAGEREWLKSRLGVTDKDWKTWEGLQAKLRRMKMVE